MTAKKEIANLPAKTEDLLKHTAKEINARLAKAAKYIEKADDFRLAAACFLSTAKEECLKANIAFKGWCEDNIDRSYEDARKLVPIGHAENAKKGEGAKMLQDLRENNAARARKSRKKRIVSAKVDVFSPMVESPERARFDPEMTKAVSIEEAKDMFNQLTAKTKLIFAEWTAKEIGAVLKMEGKI